MNKNIWSNVRMNKFAYFLTALILLYIIFFSALQFQRYSALIGTLDLAGHVQVIRNTIHGHMFQLLDHYQAQNGNFIYALRHCFAFHFQPLILLYIPFYLIFRAPFALQFFHTFCIALGALPIYFIAKKELNDDFAGLLFSLCYLLYFPLQAANLFSFSTEILATPFLLFTFYYLWKGAFKIFIVFLILSLMIKENMPGIGFMLGLYIFFFVKNRRLGIFTCLLSLVWVYLALFMIMPHYAGGTASFSYLASNLSELMGRIKMISYHPILTLRNNIFAPPKRILLSYLFKPLLFLPLLSPGVLLISLLIFLEILLAKSRLYTCATYYYCSIIPFLFIAAIFAIKRIISLNRLFPEKIRKIGKKKILLYPLLIFLLIWNAHDLPFRFKPYFPPYPISERARTARKIIASIPPSASTGCQMKYIDHFCQRERYYQVEDLTPNPDYIFIDSQHFSLTDPIPIILKYLGVRNYELIALKDGFFLFKKEEVKTVYREPWQVLGKIPKEKLVSTLLETLGNPDAGFRIVGAFSLGEVGDQKVIPALIETLQDMDRGVRMVAAYSLGEIRDQRAKEALIATLKDEITVRAAAAQSLVKLGDSSGRAVLEELMSNEEVRYWLNRQEAAPFLYLITGKCYHYKDLVGIVKWKATEELKEKRQVWLNKYKGGHP